jgi:8-oxo-dGTP pyrophosphatase MutT (NUDIX family)
MDYVRRLRALVGSETLSHLPAVCVAIRDAESRVLLAHHVETNLWGLPGGTIEPGETPADAAVREAWEETGLLVRLTRLVGVFGSVVRNTSCRIATEIERPTSVPHSKRP